MAGSSQVVHLWKEWGLQALVLLSFALQVELLVLAELRRRKDSGVLRAFVWLAYLLADSTAIYVLGHLSVTSRCSKSTEPPLTAFWAPFLLLHLGGQDNITAYAIEDNRLWLRHLQTLAVQVGGAAYVLIEFSSMGSSPRSSSLLRPASILMFLVGVAKYGERLWALKCANSSPSAGNKYRTFRALTVHTDVPPMATSADRDTEALLSVAHMLLDVPTDLLKGPLAEVVVPYINLRREEAYKVAEMQLSLMHDTFYTKSKVTHTWYGLCIRVASLLAAAAALLLFLFHLLLGDRHDHKEGYSYNGVDVAVTWVLLVGAVVLEIVSMSRVMFSSWTCALLARSGHDPGWPAGKGNVWNWLGRAVIAAIRRKARAASWARYWSGSMGQQDLLRLCARSRASRSSKVARWMEVEDWWNRLAFSGSAVPVPASVKNLVVDNVLLSGPVSFPNPERIPNSRGQAALRRWGLHEELAWTVDSSIGLEVVIVVWHVATSIYLHWYKEQAQEDGTSSAQAAAEAAETLSNYMLSLLASRTYMLPSPANRNVYVEMCFHLTTLQNQYRSAGELAGVLRSRGEDDSSGPAPRFLPEHSRAQFGFADILGVACKLGAKLVGMEPPHDSQPPPAEAGDDNKLKLIEEVWVEILCYASYRCVAYSHAKQIGNGGELVTVVAFLLQYVKRINRQIVAEEETAPVP